MSGLLGRRRTSCAGPSSSDGAAAEEHNAIRDLVGEAQLMGRDDHRQLVLNGQTADHLQHLVDELGIERGGRLVEQQHAGVRRQRASDGDALLLAAGQMPRQRVGAMGKADALKQLTGAALRVEARQAVHPAQRTGNVFERGQVAKQVEVLEHHADANFGPLARRACAGLPACRPR